MSDPTPESATNPQPTPALATTAAREPAEPRGTGAADAATAWHALRHATVVAPLPAVGSLRVTGADRADFLHGQLAHDVRGLTDGAARRSLLLDLKGHARAEMTVQRRRDDVHLAVEDDAAPWVHEQLRAHVVFDAVEIHHLRDLLATVTVQGPGTSALLADLGWPMPEPGRVASVPVGDATLAIAPRRRSAPGGVDVHLLRADRDAVVARLAQAGAVRADAAVLEPSRIAAGLPRAGRDAGSGVLPQEIGLNDAFSTRKGCYLGQEIMARIEARGRVKRGPAGLRLAGDDVAALLGAGGPTLADRAILDGERRVGLVGGVARHPELGAIALAVLRHDVDPDAVLRLAAAPGATARRVPLPFTED